MNKFISLFHMGSFLSSDQEDEYCEEKLMFDSGLYKSKPGNSNERKYVPALCQIICPEGTGTGFFIAFKLNSNKVMTGLVTNNHVLKKENLCKQQSFIIKFDANNQTKKIILDDRRFRFTYKSNNLDITFIGFSPNELPSGVVFLKPKYSTVNNMNAYIIQHPGGEECSYARGKVLNKNGVNIIHQISTMPGSSGSPILDEEGYVIGIHKSGNENYNYGTSIECLCILANNLVSKNIIFGYD